MWKDFVKLSSLVTAKLRYSWLQKKYKSVESDKRFNWNWSEKGFNRIALVNYLLSKTKHYETKYLEIGCAGNDLFDAVACRSKTGVDPARGGTHRMTSDDFFSRNEEKFDVIFIDGLHHYEQVHRDAVSSVQVLNRGGWIAFHDFLPSDWKEHHVPRLNVSWTGDCWKLAIELSKTPGIDFKIINIDRGVGVFRVVDGPVSITDLSADLARAEFSVFVDHLPDLPLIEWEDAVKWINEGSSTKMLGS